MKDLVSVVIPIYNVEKYLRKCIETVTGQTYTNIEIILVNDGSTDNSLEICKEFKEKDNRIKIINKKNGGLSDARNVGLKNAQGKYICFIDSDDFISENYIEELHNCITENKAQIAVCNYERVSEDEKTTFRKNIISQTISGKKAIEKLNDKEFGWVSTVAWNKLYDINLFKDIIYPVGKIHEDEFTTYKLYYLAKKVVITSKCLYYYRMVPTSITNRKFNIKRLDALEALDERVRFLKEKELEKSYRVALVEYEKLLIANCMNCKTYLKNSKNIQEKIIKKFRENYSEVIRFNECSIINKIKFTIAYIAPMLYYYMRKANERIIIKKFIMNILH